MSRSNSDALESGDANDFAYGNEQPTKRLPMLTPFALAQEARRLDEEARKRDEAARAALDDERYDTDDEPTLDAPSPVMSVHAKGEPEPTPVPVRITARPPALRGLVLTRPAPPKSTPRVEVSPMAMISASAVPAVAAPSAARALETLRALAAVPAIAAAPATLVSQATFTIRLPKPTPETYLVAGIWAMALSLVAVLMFMASSA
jgi:hypothetical protein